MKQIDADGSFSYSKIVSLHQNSSSAIKIFPNPAVKNCTIYFDAVAKGNAVLKIFDINGKLQKQIAVTVKQSQITSDVSSFTAGIYFCKLETPGKTLTQKLIVAK